MFRLEVMLTAVRATHEHLDLEVLDALTRNGDRLPAVIEEIAAERAASSQPLLAGTVVISTCNRLEVYLDTERFHDAVDVVTEAVSRTSGLDREVVSLCLEAAMDTPVPQHLFEVTSGLRSLVLGEAEIAGQVKTSFETARREGRTTSMLHDLFQHAFRCAKRVATQAPVGAAGRSGAAVALDRAEVELGGFDGRTVLIVGTGAYARLGVAELLRRGVQDVRVFSRSGRASGFAQRQGVHVVPEGGLDQALIDADLVLACSGRGTSLFPEQFLPAGRTVVLDLALHSDLHPLVRHLKGVTVLGLADLAMGGEASEDPALAEAEQIVVETVEAFHQQQEVRRIDPAMAALRRQVADTADAEVDRLRRDVDGRTAELLERSIRRILAKVMHDPAERARHLAETGFADAYVEAFHTIFGIDISSGARTGGGPAESGSVAGEPADGDPAAGAPLEGAPAEGASPAGWMRVDRTVPPRLTGPVEVSAASSAITPAGAQEPMALSAGTIARLALREGRCPAGHGNAEELAPEDR